jgi:hypothetical protein
MSQRVTKLDFLVPMVLQDCKAESFGSNPRSILLSAAWFSSEWLLPCKDYAEDML